jgi:TRAP-type C4-dicarboxylate transport system substrate-binding protein
MPTRHRSLAALTRRTLAAAMGASALLLASGAAHAQMEIKLGHVGGPGSLFERSANEFARLANERLGNKAKVVVFGSSQLGGDTEMMQKLRLGTLELSIPSTVMSSTVPAFGMFEMPYLVKNREHMMAIEKAVVWPALAPMADENAKDVQPFVYKTAAELDKELVDKIKAAGVQVNEPDKNAFIAASKAVYADFGKEVPEGAKLVDTAVDLGAKF